MKIENYKDEFVLDEFVWILSFGKVSEHGEGVDLPDGYFITPNRCKMILNCLQEISRQIHQSLVPRFWKRTFDLLKEGESYFS